MRHMSSKDQAFDWAIERAQQNGTDYRIVELNNGMFAVGTMKKIEFHYPDGLGWNVRFQY